MSPASMRTAVAPMTLVTAVAAHAPSTASAAPSMVLSGAVVVAVTTMTAMAATSAAVAAVTVMASSTPMTPVTSGAGFAERWVQFGCRHHWPPKRQGGRGLRDGGCS